MSAGQASIQVEAAQPRAIRLRLPATTANLGPGFDALGLAFGFALTIEARVLQNAIGRDLAIAATGRDAARCTRTRNNMIFETYRDLLTRAGRTVLPLDLRIHNEIPLGMGCGSSAAALLGAVMLANHFGALNWSLGECIDEATRREGHPDNVTACALGSMTTSAVDAGRVSSAVFGAGLKWRLLLALPTASLATEKARALLPTEYSRADAVANVQRASLLVAAFALGRGDLLRVAMQDRMHQPYRMEVCPLLPLLLPLAGEAGVLGVALSGAGPGVLVVVDEKANAVEVAALMRLAAADPALEIVETCIGAGASVELI
jgi:homoserine kinase